MSIELSNSGEYLSHRRAILYPRITTEVRKWRCGCSVYDVSGIRHINPCSVLHLDKFLRIASELDKIILENEAEAHEIPMLTKAPAGTTIESNS